MAYHILLDRIALYVTFCVLRLVCCSICRVRYIVWKVIQYDIRSVFQYVIFNSLLQTKTFHFVLSVPMDTLHIRSMSVLLLHWTIKDKIVDQQTNGQTDECTEGKRHILSGSLHPKVAKQQYV